METTTYEYKMPKINKCKVDKNVCCWNCEHAIPYENENVRQSNKYYCDLDDESLNDMEQHYCDHFKSI